MRNFGKQKTNWLLTALLIIAFQYIAYTFALPMLLGLEVLTLEYLQSNSWVIGIVAVVSILLAYVCAYMIKSQFYGAGLKAGGGY